MADKVVGFKIQIKGEKEILTLTKVLGLLNTQMILINTTLREIIKRIQANGFVCQAIGHHG